MTDLTSADAVLEYMFETNDPRSFVTFGPLVWKYGDFAKYKEREKILSILQAILKLELPYVFELFQCRFTHASFSTLYSELHGLHIRFAENEDHHLFDYESYYENICNDENPFDWNAFRDDLITRLAECKS